MATSRSLMRAPNNGPARPFLKWAGGKTQLLEQLARHYPPGPLERYLEPFVGCGAVFFDVHEKLRPKQVVLADNNEELMNVYRCVRDSVEEVIGHLKRHRHDHAPEHFYGVRELRPDALTYSERAARFIYLNKTCYNGLYRVNSRGEFNVPLGRYPNPPILDERNLRAASLALHGSELKVSHFRDMPSIAAPGDFIYLDPPYDPVSETSYFTSYTQDSFGKPDQEALAEVVCKLHSKGCHVVLSNSDTPFIRKLYKRSGLKIDEVRARRSINSRADRRGLVTELVVWNDPPPARRQVAARSGRPRWQAARSQ